MELNTIIYKKISFYIFIIIYIIMNYYEKYLKYKNKYIQLKSELEIKKLGGDIPIINNIENINLFTDLEMESFLNPIYGKIMYELGYIKNNYFLKKSNFIDTKISQYINNIIKTIPGTIQPNNDIMKKIKPIDIGRYIALKYIYMKNPNLINITGTNPKFGDVLKKISNNDKKTLIRYISNVRKYNPLEKTDEIYFHILLYCLWWLADTDKGIKEYYLGINDTFCIINKYLPIKYSYLTSSNKELNPESFEKIVIDITYESFKIYNQ